MFFPTPFSIPLSPTHRNPAFDPSQCLAVLGEGLAEPPRLGEARGRRARGRRSEAHTPTSPSSGNREEQEHGPCCGRSRHKGRDGGEHGVSEGRGSGAQGEEQGPRSARGADGDRREGDRGGRGVRDAESSSTSQRRRAAPPLLWRRRRRLFIFLIERRGEPGTVSDRSLAS